MFVLTYSRGRFITLSFLSEAIVTGVSHIDTLHLWYLTQRKKVEDAEQENFILQQIGAAPVGYTISENKFEWGSCLKQ